MFVKKIEPRMFILDPPGQKVPDPEEPDLQNRLRVLKRKMLIYYFCLFFPASNSSITIVDDSETTDASSREDINTGDAGLNTTLAEKTSITAKQADIKPTTIVNITTAVEEVTNKSTMNSSGKSETASTVQGSYPHLILTTYGIFINLICS
jgi:hypothetical protein